MFREVKFIWLVGIRVGINIGFLIFGLDFFFNNRLFLVSFMYS